MAAEIKAEKYIWDENDFKELGWHDNRLYSISFDHKHFQVGFEIDYIYKWKEDLSGYWVVPAFISFENVMDLKIDLSFNDTQDLIIEDIFRSEAGLVPNKLLLNAKYIIRANVGDICFTATGFKMKLLEDPRYSLIQDLDRTPHQFKGRIDV